MFKENLESAVLKINKSKEFSKSFKFKLWSFKEKYKKTSYLLFILLSLIVMSSFVYISSFGLIFFYTGIFVTLVLLTLLFACKIEIKNTFNYWALDPANSSYFKLSVNGSERLTDKLFNDILLVANEMNASEDDISKIRALREEEIPFGWWDQFYNKIAIDSFFKENNFK